MMMILRLPLNSFPCVLCISQTENKTKMNGSVAPFIPPGGGVPADYHAEEEEVEIHHHGSWQEQARTGDDGFPITATAFDAVEELLWVSTAVIQQECMYISSC